jgi:Flp pilus assembly protein TadG
MSVKSGSRQRGAAIVEQALLLPVLLAILFGIIDMSRALYSYTYVSYIAREATRWASVRSSSSMNGSSTGHVQGFVAHVVGLGLDDRAITSTTNYIAPPNNTPLCPGGTGNANNKPGCIVQVTVNYDFRFIMPFLPSAPLTLSSESQMLITQ